MTRHCLGCGAIVSLSSLVISTLRLCCTFCFAFLHMLRFFFLLLYLVFLQARRSTRTHSANHGGFGWFFCGACGSSVWVPLFSVGMKRREREGARRASVSS
ncbi:hypothetical protein Tc00.1047053505975.10 [Trypanosoma cruzi]|uniref:Uncharacterized protein n=1 Tax=Trypanosoma cruzi (strain CL Brener) TaxID=353153 RepID=Q4D3K4_TRYCC|nr:uncharacterized protein Tc00.1047053505975.10 [Trypanosoma cruzi]EAN87105.1 hypothetical protein Tc00.1047053505975.10 [Trypanosoma cruzi]|eukprot:XP_808956.1 hypothetical protein Tc00.1047053505975.10 [Trypanosoma cruzi strain CL Brener]